MLAGVQFNLFIGWLLLGLYPKPHHQILSLHEDQTDNHSKYHFQTTTPVFLNKEK